MTEFTKYRRSQIAELRPYMEGEKILGTVSVSNEDVKTKRIPEIAWAAFVGLWRSAAPNILVASSIMAAFAMGELGVNHWLMLLPMIVASFGVGLGQDRAEARAAKEWAIRFWGLIETDHMLEITVTHKDQKA